MWVFTNIRFFFFNAAFWKQTGPGEAGQRVRHLLSAEMWITVQPGPIDVINQVNETQRQ